MTLRFAFVVLFAVVLSSAFALAAPPTSEPAQLPAVETALREHLAPHPRLLLDGDGGKAITARASRDPRLAQLLQRTITCAESILTLPPLERKLIGRRLLSVSRDAQYRIATLSLAYRVTGDRRYLDGATQCVLAVAAFEDFHPEHFLDTAEMTAGLAIGYDWLWPDLTAEQRATIRRAIVEKGIRPSYAKPMSWARGQNNWNQVCNGGMVLGALAVAEDEPALARRVIERAIDGLPVIMKHYSPDGAYPEGVSYWAYGTTYNCLAIGAMQSALGDDFGLSRQGDFLKTADYRLHLFGPTGVPFVYSDCSPREAMKAAAFFLAQKRNDASLLFNEIKSLDRLLALSKVSLGTDADDWLALTWISGDLARVKPPQTHYVGLGDTPVATHRTSWDDDATFVAIKGGSPSTSHAHMDIGSFCLDALGQRWADALGMQDYNSLESKGVAIWNGSETGQRWKVYRIGPMSKNILVVNGHHQVVLGRSAILRSTERFTIVNTGPVYAGQLEKAQRGILLREDQSVRLQDEVTATHEEPAAVRWAMLTRADIKLDGPAAVLSLKGVQLQCRVISPAGATLKVVSTDPPNDYDAPNPGTRLLTFEVPLAPGAAGTIVVDFTPGPNAGNAPSVAPLSTW